MKRSRRFVALLPLLASLSQASPAAAVDAQEARQLATQELSTVASAAAELRNDLDRSARAGTPAQKRLALGELSLRTRDYDRAIDSLSQLVELHRQGKVGRNPHADALFLLGEAYFESGQLLSARRHYSELLERAEEEPYSDYAGRSLARLVDVALRTARRESLSQLSQRASQLKISDATGSFRYAMGKLAFARGDLAAARSLLASVPATSEYVHQAQYLLGAVAMREALPEMGSDPESQARLHGTLEPGRMQPAIEQFRRVTQLAGDTEAHRQVIDTAWLAIGRLYYESEAFLESAEAYIHVERTSPLYYEMLFELAWVYVRVGDYQRAERALELLSVAAPDTLHVADGALLRADLMLRSGRFAEALTAYEAVRDRFEPARGRIQIFLDETKDPAIYYDRLVEEGMAVAGITKLPELVLEWVKEEARDERVFAVIEDVTRAREVLRRGRRLAAKLGAVLAAPSRARAFPALEKALERTFGLLNQLAHARQYLAQGLEDVDDGDYSGELGRVREQRRDMMSEVAALPVLRAEFSKRDEEGGRQWSRVSQALQRVTLETDRLQAVINGLERVLREPEQHGVTHDEDSRRRFRAEVEANQRDLEVYRARVERYREEVEKGRVQVGVGDPRYQRDEAVRKQFRDAQAAEAKLVVEVGGEGAAYVRSLASAFDRIQKLEAELEATRRDLEGRVLEGSQELMAKVGEETERLEVYTQKLDALDQHARLLVGEVAMQNFMSVSRRLSSIVLRADVGIVQQAWEVREQQRLRLRGLQRQRALEEQALDDELREVFDDGGGL